MRYLVHKSLRKRLQQTKKVGGGRFFTGKNRLAAEKPDGEKAGWTKSSMDKSPIWIGENSRRETAGRARKGRVTDRNKTKRRINLKISIKKLKNLRKIKTN